MIGIKNTRKINLFNTFLANAERSPNKIAYKFEDTALTYSETAMLALKLSRYLTEQGVKKGTHIGIISNNSLEFALLFWSSAYLGAVLVPLMPSYNFKTTKYLSQATDVELILVEKSLMPRKEQLVDDFKVIPLLGIEELTQDGKDIKVTESDAKPDAPYIITLTSGSTSLPKPIVFSQKTKINRSINGTKDIYDLSERDITLVSTPMYHSMGMRMSILPLLIGATGVILPRFSPALWVDRVEKEGVTFPIVVSNQIEAILDYLEVENMNIRSLEKLVSSSYILKIETKKRFLERVKCRFYECYGTSEIGIATNIEFEEGGSNLESVGRPLPYVDIKILDENDQPLPVNEEGEIAVKTITGYSGYYKNEKATKESYWKDYFRTGDVGYLEEDGYLYYLGRKNDVIKYGAINLYPGDIEDVLVKLEGIKECAVIGVEDRYLGEVPLAAVVAEGKIEKKVLRKFCLENLADYQVPIDFVFVDEIPKNELGKVQKFRLKNDILKKARIRKYPQVKRGPPS